MSARVEARFAALAAEGRKGLIPFITAGDPHPDWTVDVMHALVAGARSAAGSSKDANGWCWRRW